MPFWIVSGIKVGLEMFHVEQSGLSVVLMRNEAAENDVDGGQGGESDSRPSMRALGRSASTKIKQGLDWNR